MDQASNVRETAAFARRLVYRTLTVAGGVAAGTAIAWYLSTATASAEPPADSFGDANPVLAEVVQPLGTQLGTQFDGGLDDLAERLPDPPSRDPLGEFGDKLEEAADQVGGRVEPAGVLPGCDLCDVDEADLPEVELPVQIDGSGLDPAGTGPAAAPVTTVGKVTGQGVDPERTAARTATDRAYANGVPHRGSPEPSLPVLPAWPAPLPPSAPAPGHSGHTVASHGDSVPFAAFPWLDRTPAPVRGLTAPAADATTAGGAGAQPGIAPD